MSDIQAVTYQGSAATTPSDTVNDALGPFAGFVVTGTGTVSIVMFDGSTLTLPSITASAVAFPYAFNRVKVRNLKTGRTIERNFKSGESVEAADVVDMDMQYLYSDGEFFHFMVPENFEQHAATKAVVGDAAQWLKEGTVCIVTLWNNVPIVVTPPPHIELKVVETDPGLRGDTATGGQKSAKLETGAVVRVPLFINEGEILKVDTRTGAYISRAKQ